MTKCFSSPFSLHCTAYKVQTSSHLHVIGSERTRKDVPAGNFYFCLNLCLYLHARRKVCTLQQSFNTPAIVLPVKASIPAAMAAEAAAKSSLNLEGLEGEGVQEGLFLESVEPTSGDADVAHDEASPKGQEQGQNDKENVK